MSNVRSCGIIWLKNACLPCCYSRRNWLACALLHCLPPAKQIEDDDVEVICEGGRQWCPRATEGSAPEKVDDGSDDDCIFCASCEEPRGEVQPHNDLDVEQLRKDTGNFLAGFRNTVATSKGRVLSPHKELFPVSPVLPNSRFAVSPNNVGQYAYSALVVPGQSNQKGKAATNLLSTGINRTSKWAQGDTTAQRPKLLESPPVHMSIGNRSSGLNHGKGGQRGAAGAIKDMAGNNERINHNALRRRDMFA